MTHATRPTTNCSASTTPPTYGHSVATYRWYRANGIGPKSWKCGRYVPVLACRRARMDGCAGSRELRRVACSDHRTGNTSRLRGIYASQRATHPRNP